MITQPIFSRRFVGREAELQLLVGTADAAAGGAVCSVVVTGDAGSGKSRLLTEFQSHPDMKRIRFVRGACYNYARAAYAPIEDMIRDLDSREPKVLQRDPELKIEIESFFRGDASGAARDSSTYRKRRAFGSIVELLRRYSAIRPTVFMIEDLHWSDLGTLELLEHIATTFAGQRAMFLVTMRHDEEDSSNIDAFLSRFERQPKLAEIRLEPLDEAAALDMIESALNGAMKLSDFERQQVVRMAAGNPLYIEELLKSLVDNPGLTQIPRNIQVAIEARLHALDEAELRLLRLAAVLVRFNAALLSALAERAPQEVAQTLSKAATLNLLAAPDAEGFYAFRHELLRRAVLQPLASDEYRLLHRHVAAYFEAQAANERFVEELALHWWESGEPERAQRYNKSAGDRAFQKYAFKDAIDYYKRAAQPAAALDGDLHLRLAKAYHHTSQLTAGIEALREALTAYQRPEALEQRVDVLLELSKEYYRVLDFERSRDALNGALAESHALNRPRVRFSVHAWECWYHAHHEHNMDAALAAAQQAESFHEGADALAVALLGEALAYTHWLRGDMAGWERAARDAVAAAKRSGDPIFIIHHLSDFASRATLMHAPLAIQLYDEALALAQAHHLGDSVPYTIAALAHTQLTSGDIPGAAANARRVLMTAVDFPFVRVVAALVAIPAAYESQDETLLHQALTPALLETAGSNVALYGQLLRAHAEIDMATGNTDRAIARLRDILARIEGAEFNERALVLVAEWKIPDLNGRAESLLHEGAKHTRHCRALLSLFKAFSSSGAERTLHATEALGMFEEMGWTLDAARCLEVLGKFEGAADLYKRCGARASALRVARRAGRAPAAFGLTAREKEIADLVASGKTNKAIAQELVLSDRTVENHLTSIYSKLAIKSRTELAARWSSAGTRDVVS